MDHLVAALDPHLRRYGIRRIDRPGKSIYFLVKIQRKKEIRTRTFTASVWGSEEAAFAAACQWRDETLRDMEPMTRSVFAQMLRPNNTSGVPGVHRIVLRRKTKHGVVEDHLWLARSPNTGKGPQRRAAFSISRYGEAKALELAAAARARLVLEDDAYRVPNAPAEAVPAFKPGTRRKRLPPAPDAQT